MRQKPTKEGFLVFFFSSLLAMVSLGKHGLCNHVLRVLSVSPNHPPTQQSNSTEGE